MNYIDLPDGSQFPVKSGESYDQALAAARKFYPDAFPKAEVATDDKRGFLGSFGRTFKSAVEESGPTALAGLEAQTRATGLESVANWLEKQRGEEKPAEIEPVKLRNAIDSWQNFKQWLGESAGSGLGSTVLPVAGALVGGLGGAGIGALGGPAAPGTIPIGGIVGGYLGAGATALPLNTGDLYQELLKEGVPKQRAAELAAMGGIPISVPDLVSMGVLARPFLKAPQKVAIKELAKQIAEKEGFVGTVKDYAKGIGKGLAAEGITEGPIQQSMQEAIIAGATDKPFWTADRMENIAQAGISGALAGAPFGAAGRFSERRQQRNQLEDMEAAERLAQAKQYMAEMEAKNAEEKAKKEKEEQLKQAATAGPPSPSKKELRKRAADAKRITAEQDALMNEDMAALEKMYNTTADTAAFQIPQQHFEASRAEALARKEMDFFTDPEQKAGAALRVKDAEKRRKALEKLAPNYGIILAPYDLHIDEAARRINALSETYTKATEALKTEKNPDKVLKLTEQLRSAERLRRKLVARYPEAAELLIQQEERAQQQQQFQKQQQAIADSAEQWAPTPEAGTDQLALDKQKAAAEAKARAQQQREEQAILAQTRKAQKQQIAEQRKADEEAARKHQEEQAAARQEELRRMLDEVTSTPAKTAVTKLQQQIINAESTGVITPPVQKALGLRVGAPLDLNDPKTAEKHILKIYERSQEVEQGELDEDAVHFVARPLRNLQEYARNTLRKAEAPIPALPRAGTPVALPSENIEGKEKDSAGRPIPDLRTTEAQDYSGIAENLAAMQAEGATPHYGMDFVGKTGKENFLAAKKTQQMADSTLDSFYEQLDALKTAESLGGANPAAAATTKELIDKKARVLQDAYIALKLKEAALRRHLAGHNPMVHQEARSLADRLNALLDKAREDAKPISDKARRPVLTVRGTPLADTGTTEKALKAPLPQRPRTRFAPATGLLDTTDELLKTQITYKTKEGKTYAYDPTSQQEYKDTVLALHKLYEPYTYVNTRGETVTKSLEEPATAPTPRNRWVEGIPLRRKEDTRAAITKLLRPAIAPQRNFQDAPFALTKLDTRTGHVNARGQIVTKSIQQHIEDRESPRIAAIAERLKGVQAARKHAEGLLAAEETHTETELHTKKFRDRVAKAKSAFDSATNMYNKARSNPKTPANQLRLMTKTYERTKREYEQLKEQSENTAMRRAVEKVNALKSIEAQLAEELRSTAVDTSPTRKRGDLLMELDNVLANRKTEVAKAEAAGELENIRRVLEDNRGSPEFIDEAREQVRRVANGFVPDFTRIREIQREEQNAPRMEQPALDFSQPPALPTSPENRGPFTAQEISDAKKMGIPVARVREWGKAGGIETSGRKAERAAVTGAVTAAEKRRQSVQKDIENARFATAAEYAALQKQVRNARDELDAANTAFIALTDARRTRRDAIGDAAYAKESRSWNGKLAAARLIVSGNLRELEQHEEALGKLRLKRVRESMHDAALQNAENELTEARKALADFQQRVITEDSLAENAWSEPVRQGELGIAAFQKRLDSDKVQRLREEFNRNVLSDSYVRGTLLRLKDAKLRYREYADRLEKIIRSKMESGFRDEKAREGAAEALKKFQAINGQMDLTAEEFDTLLKDYTDFYDQYRQYFEQALTSTTPTHEEQLQRPELGERKYDTTLTKGFVSPSTKSYSEKLGELLKSLAHEAQAHKDAITAAREAAARVNVPVSNLASERAEAIQRITDQIKERAEKAKAWAEKTAPKARGRESEVKALIHAQGVPPTVTTRTTEATVDPESSVGFHMEVELQSVVTLQGQLKEALGLKGRASAEALVKATEKALAVDKPDTEKKRTIAHLKLAMDNAQRRAGYSFLIGELDKKIEAENARAREEAKTTRPGISEEELKDFQAGSPLWYDLNRQRMNLIYVREDAGMYKGRGAGKPARNEVTGSRKLHQTWEQAWGTAPPPQLLTTTTTQGLDLGAVGQPRIEHPEYTWRWNPETKTIETITTPHPVPDTGEPGNKQRIAAGDTKANAGRVLRNAYRAALEKFDKAVSKPAERIAEHQLKASQATGKGNRTQKRLREGWIAAQQKRIDAAQTEMLQREQEILERAKKLGVTDFDLSKEMAQFREMRNRELAAQQGAFQKGVINESRGRPGKTPAIKNFTAEIPKQSTKPLIEKSRGAGEAASVGGKQPSLAVPSALEETERAELQRQAQEYAAKRLEREGMTTDDVYYTDRHAQYYHEKLAALTKEQTAPRKAAVPSANAEAYIKAQNIAQKEGFQPGTREYDERVTYWFNEYKGRVFAPANPARRTFLKQTGSLLASPALTKLKAVSTTPNMSAAEVEKVKASLPKDIADHIHVYNTLDDVPEADKLIADNRGLGRDNLTGWLTAHGDIYVVLGQHANLADLGDTLLHELKHYRADTWLGADGLKALTNKVFANGVKGAQAIADALDAGHVIEAIQRAEAALTIQKEGLKPGTQEYNERVDYLLRNPLDLSDEAKLEIVREMVAEAQTFRPVRGTFTEKAKAIVHNFIQKIVQAARRFWVNTLGFGTHKQKTTQEIFDLLKTTKEAMFAGELGPYRSPTGTTAFRMDPAMAALGRGPELIFGKPQTAVNKATALLHGMSVETEARFFDRLLGPIKAVEKGGATPAQLAQVTYKLRTTQDLHNWLAAVIEHGAPQVVRDPTTSGDQYTYRTAGKSSRIPFKDVVNAIKKVGLSGDNNERVFGFYMAMHRADSLADGWERLNTRYRTDPAYRAELDAEVAKFRQQLKADPKLHAALEDARVLYNKFNGEMLEFQADVGALPRETLKKLQARGDYTPWYRREDDGTTTVLFGEEHPIRIGDIKNQPYMQKLLGGDKPIELFFDGAVRNMNMLLEHSMRNGAARELAHTLDSLGLVDGGIRMGPLPTNAQGFEFKTEPTAEEYKKGGDHIGQRHVLFSNDFEKRTGVPTQLAIRGMEGIITMIPTGWKIAALPGRWLRKAILRTPLYAVRQLSNDIPSFLFNSGAKLDLPLLLKTTWDVLRPGMRADEKMLHEAGFLGGNVFTGTEEDIATLSRRLSSVSKNWRPISKSFHGLMGLLDAAAQKVDAHSRLYVYRSLRKQGMSHMEAMLGVRNALDFTRRGYDETLHMLAYGVPFMNTQMQSLYAVWNAGTGRSPYSKRLNIMRKFWMWGIASSMLGVMYAASMQDDDDYKNMTDEERMRYWIIPKKWTGTKSPIRIRKPFEVGTLFPGMAEGIYGRMAGDRQGRGYAPIFLAAMGNIGLPLLPPAVKLVLEQTTGIDFYTGAPIESQHDEQLHYTERYGPKTTEVSKVLSSTVGSWANALSGGKWELSPKDFDHIARGLFSNIGTGVLSLMNPMLRDSKAGAGEIEGRMHEDPWFGPAFQNPQQTGYWVRTARNEADRFKQARHTYEQYIQQGRTEDAERFKQEFGRQIAAGMKGSPVNQFTKRMDELSEYRTKIINAPSTRFSPEKKRELLDRIDAAQLKVSKELITGLEKAKVEPRAGW